MSLASRLSELFRPVTAALRRSSRRLHPESLVRVGFDDGQIVGSFPEGTFRRVAWAKVTEVRIRTTSEGPYLPDVFWVVYAEGDEPRLVYPQGAVGERELLAEMQRRLPAFDNDAVIRAMSCTEEAWFVAWRKGAGAQVSGPSGA